ncbi:NfeD family protein [Oceanobacillus bengalensis]|uniref:Nodulation protein NfeD n=1 Tax=Oceanobacillus bengalensis TaxID=1435466 RepID=A0A494Z6C1_9BACI|nr:nodulation protein NfeD [Oceanobacillus bengalensis]RKQ17855.1 nodulation protein NfeD [Oceanobacillus bengalensis]
MQWRKRTLFYITFIGFLLLIPFIHIEDVETHAEDGSGNLVYVIPVEREVERGLEAFLKRSSEEAIESGADHIIFEIDTPGGRVDSAGQIATLLQSLEVPTTSFIINEALSAGSYIALNTDNIYFVPHATMGASGVINGDGTAADEKAQSAWIEKMSSAAQSNGRDPLYAIAMADASIDLPEYGAPEGKFLTLGPNDAVEVGYAEGIVDDRVELLHELGLSNATVVETEPSLAEEVARFLTNPVVYSILLSVASLGLIVELYSPGFGVPGIMGLTALILFFYGHIVAGLAGMEAIILLVLGVILIIAEFFVPGGIVGLLGIGAIIGSLLMSGYDIGQMTLSISIAFVVAVIASIVLFKRIGLDKGVFRHIILKDSTKTELGYVSAVNRLELIGLEGTAITPLRPSGTGEFDKERIDVISEGTFIDKDSPIKVVKVEGVRVVVRELK